MFLRFIKLAGLLLSLLSVAVISAQGSCSALLEQALDEVDFTCGDIDRNEACYGFNRVNASFLVPVEDNFFTVPADTADVLDIETIATTPYNATNNEWGVAVMSLQANVPNTIPGQSVIFLLIGDVEVENEVAPDSAFEFSDGIDVTVSSSANVRSGAGLQFNVVGGAVAGSTLVADGVSDDGDWVRVAFGTLPAWISRDLVTSSDDIAALPVIDDAVRSPMQAFYLRTGVGQPSCEEAPPSVLFVESSEGTPVELTINGLDIRIGSQIGFLQTDPDTLTAFITKGTLTIPNGEGEADDQIFRAGQSVDFCLGEPQDVALDEEDNDRPITCVEPSNFDTSVFCSIDGEANAALITGLDFNCNTATFVPSGNGNIPPTTDDNNNSECAGFVRFDPPNAAATETTFRWSSVPGAVFYEFRLFSNDGRFVYGERTSGNQLTVNLGQVDTGSPFDWEVSAYFLENSNAPDCTTPRGTLVKGSDPNEPPGGYRDDVIVPGVFGWDAVCLSSTAVNVTWFNNDAGVSYTFEVIGLFGDTSSFTTSAINGSQVLSTTFYDADSVTISGSDGTTGTIATNCGAFTSTFTWSGRCVGAAANSIEVTWSGLPPGGSVTFTVNDVSTGPPAVFTTSAASGTQTLTVNTGADDVFVTSNFGATPTYFYFGCFGGT